MTTEGQVAIVPAVGDILGGDQPPGTVGSNSLISVLREIRRDTEVEAVVLRVDSGGGSTFASEEIRRELELVRQAGKPIVVSMGGMAASGRLPDFASGGPDLGLPGNDHRIHRRHHDVPDL